MMHVKRDTAMTQLKILYSMNFRYLSGFQLPSMFDHLPHSASGWHRRFNHLVVREVTYSRTFLVRRWYIIEKISPNFSLGARFCENYLHRRQRSLLHNFPGLQVAPDSSHLFSG